MQSQYVSGTAGNSSDYSLLCCWIFCRAIPFVEEKNSGKNSATFGKIRDLWALSKDASFLTWELF